MPHRHGSSSHPLRREGRSGLVRAGAQARVAMPKPKRPPRSVDMESGDGVVAFRLVCGTFGIYVERSRLQPDAARLVHFMQFLDDEDFERWCESDRLRLAYPLLFENLKRSVRGLLASAR